MKQCLELVKEFHVISCNDTKE